MTSEALTGFRLSPQQAATWNAPHGAQPLATQVLYRLTGPWTAEALRAQLVQAIEQHEILRTTFRLRSGLKLPLQVISDEATLTWHVSDISGQPASEQEQSLQRLRDADSSAGFDLDRGPVVRANLVKLADQRHALLVSWPALCGDSATAEVLAQALLGPANAGAAGDTAAEAPLQYADFSEWQNQLLEGAEPEAQTGRQFWSRSEIAGAAGQTLLLQRRCEQRPPFAPRRLPVALTPDLARQVTAAARQSQVGTDVILLAAWRALLWRLAGGAAPTIGVVPATRKQTELAGAAGLFFQPLPVAFEGEDLSGSELVRTTQTAVNATLEWQEYYNASEHPVSPLGFEFIRAVALQGPDGRQIEIAALASDIGPYVAKLSCLAVGTDLHVSLSCDPQLLAEDSCQRIAHYYPRLLGALLSAPTAAISQHPLLDDAERTRVLEAWNQTTVAFRNQSCLHQLFEAQAARVPDRTAVVFESRRLTYAELNAAANRLAHHLIGQGVGRNVPVGLCLDRSAEAIIGLLGIWKAGGAYVPLHPELPPARLAQMISSTGMQTVVTQSAHTAALREGGAKLVCLDGGDATLAQQSPANPAAGNAPEDLAYVIFTSGSTGLPKGVAVRHRNLVNYTDFILGELGLAADAGDAWSFATVSTISADLGNTCVLPSLLSGGCLHVMSYETAMGGELFARYASQNPIDVLKITPSHLSALLAIQEGAGLLPRKFLFLGGEASSWDLIDRVRSAGTCRVINHYGPTETTVGSLTFRVDEGLAAREFAATVPVGRPIANTVLYVLDAHRQPVPVGTPGELYIGGAGVAQGYYQQAELTAERFVTNPFQPDAAARMYRTGDRVRYLADGVVEFLGRADEQVKIRGFRVEPAEVAAILQRRPGVDQALVVARDSKSGDKQLIAYFVPGLPEPTPEQLTRHLAEFLPDYMLPSAYVRLERIPLTANGKVDRAALPDPDSASGGAVQGYVAPANPVEEQVAVIWQEVLKVERVGTRDNFFELGGHSLLATQVISRVRAVLQVQLPLRTLFESPTVAGLATAIAELDPGQSQEAELASMLAELEGLSDEEIERLLAQESQESGG